MSAVVIDGGLVHYEAVGRGRPVLFLHGWLGSWRYWMSTMQALSTTYRTYALDLWGFGDSDKSKFRYNVSDYVTLIDDFVNNMGIDQMPLVGHALGATVALEYAIRHPERVDKLMLISLPINSDSISRRLLHLGNNSVISRMIWRRQQITFKEVQQEAEKSDEKAIRTSLQSVAQLDIRSRIQLIGQLRDTLVLTVYGEKDDVIDPSPTRELNGNWQNVRPIGLAESKHFPMLDEAAKFNRLLEDFLEVDNDLSTLELKEEWRRRTR
jgi:pimeloyl-ACP methyl ester carboxylesterase